MKNDNAAPERVWLALDNFDKSFWPKRVWPQRMPFATDEYVPRADGDGLRLAPSRREGIEEALAELREMFPGEINIGIDRTGGDGYLTTHGIQLRRERWSIHRRVFDTIGCGETLSEAMQKVREWAALESAARQQSKQEKP